MPSSPLDWGCGRACSKSSLARRSAGASACCIYRTEIGAMAENRTEQATPRRRQQAREKGQVLRSRDLVSAFTLLAVVALFTWHPEGWIRRWHSYFSHTLAAGALSDWNDQLPVVTWTALTVAQWAGPIL